MIDFTPAPLPSTESLQKLTIFQSMSSTEIEISRRYLSAYQLDSQHILTEEGKAGHFMCIILSGSIKIMKSSHDAKRCITTLGIDQMIGEMSLIDNKPFSATSITNEKSTILLITREQFQALTLEHPEIVFILSQRIAQTIGSRLRQTTDMLATSLTCINNMTTALNQALTNGKEQRQFITEFSHELRTPLSAILGYSDLIQDTAVEQQQPEYQEPAQRIHDSGEHLLNLINNILDLGKVESGKMSLYCQDFSIEKVINDVCATIQPTMNKNGNELRLETANDIGNFYSDEMKIRQCLLNLLGNASKFTQHGCVTISTQKQMIEQQEWLVIAVMDTGIGMDEAQVNKLFTPYQQADAGIAQRFGGTGLGLAIVFSYCHLLSGKVEVKSQPNKGTTFTLKLPTRSTALLS